MITSTTPHTDELLVQVFYQKGDDPFLVGVNGHVNSELLKSIETDAVPDATYDKGDGDYLFRAEYEPGQFDGEGRCELAPGYGLVFVEFKPVVYDEHKDDC
jgi:hypothetical protein